MDQQMAYRDRPIAQHMVNLGTKAQSSLQIMSKTMEEQKQEFGLDEYHERYTKAALFNLPGLSRKIVEKAMDEMEAAGYQFSRRQAGSVEVYALTVNEVIDIYKHRGFPAFKKKHTKAITVFLSNLKGGAGKSVSTVNLAHALRVHPKLLQHDLKILLCDIDPQASATLFLKHNLSIGSHDYTVVQAALNNLSTEELKENFIIKSIVPGVDIIPASIADGFIAANWEKICAEELPGQDPNMVIAQNVIDRLSSEYDIILLDCGPHIDPILKASICAADVLVTPLPPDYVDLHSTMQYLARLPIIMEEICNEGTNPRFNHHLAFMSKITHSAKDSESEKIAKEILGKDLMRAQIPYLSAFKRCAETFDTLISVQPDAFAGDKKSLKNAKDAILDFAYDLFLEVSNLRGE